MDPGRNAFMANLSETEMAKQLADPASALAKAANEATKEYVSKTVADSMALELTELRANNIAMRARLDAVEEFVNRLDDIQFNEAALDTKFPWRKFERDCEKTKWSVAWDRILVKKEALDEVTEQMQDAAVSNAYSQWVSNKSPETKRLLDAVLYKKAKKTSWERLCTPPTGGFDAIRAFLCDQIDDCEDDAIAAVGSKVLSAVIALEAQLVDPDSDNEPDAILNQRNAMMPIVLQLILTMRRAANKHSAQKGVDTLLLKKDLALPWQLALTFLTHRNMAQASQMSAQHPTQTSGFDGNAPSSKRGRNFGSYTAPAPASSSWLQQPVLLPHQTLRSSFEAKQAAVSALAVPRKGNKGKQGGKGKGDNKGKKKGASMTPEFARAVEDKQR